MILTHVLHCIVLDIVYTHSLVYTCNCKNHIVLYDEKANVCRGYKLTIYVVDKKHISVEAKH